MEHYFVFNGRSSRDFGVWISGGGTFNAPARDVTEVVIPGKNGVLTLDNGRYDAIDLVYPAFISKRFTERVKDFRAFLEAQTGLCRLEDTYHPDEFRLARFNGGFSVTPIVRNLGGNFEVVFRCQPQRYLKAGEMPIEFSGDGIIFNPTNFMARPLITVVGSGILTVNGISMALVGTDDETVVIDCEAMEAPGFNTNLSLIDGEFPALFPGENAIEIIGFDSVSIVPRWWTL